MTVWRNKLASQSDGDIRGQYASGYEEVIEPYGFAEYWNRPTYTEEDSRIMETKMAHAQAYRDAIKQEAIDKQLTAEALMRAQGPLSPSGLRTDIRIPSSEAAANMALAQESIDPRQASVFSRPTNPTMPGSKGPLFPWNRAATETWKQSE